MNREIEKKEAKNSLELLNKDIIEKPLAKRRVSMYLIGFLESRNDKIWTCDPLTPSQVRYLATPRPD